MKILRVIVDELPKSCHDCQFERGGGCAGFGMYPMAIILIQQNKTKPSWCPLALEYGVNIDKEMVTNRDKTLSTLTRLDLFLQHTRRDERR